MKSLKKAGKAKVANHYIYRQKASLKASELEVQGQLAILLEEESVEKYADLEGHRINGVTVPPNIAP